MVTGPLTAFASTSKSSSQPAYAGTANMVKAIPATSTFLSKVSYIHARPNSSSGLMLDEGIFR